jgi:hypothetical protein
MNVLSTRRAFIRRGLTTAIAGGVIASGALAGSYASAEAASAPTKAPTATITAHPSDTTVNSGQQFRVHGLFKIGGSPAVNRTVKIQSLNSGTWQNISGAQVSTGSDGKYAVRLILSREGTRTLRAVGITPSPNTPNAFKRFTVTVR